MAWLDSLMTRMVKDEASDLHLSSQVAPMFRVHGDMRLLTDLPVSTPDKVMEYIKEIAPKMNIDELQDKLDTDFAYEIKGVGRYRVNLFYDHKGPAMACRLVPEKILSVEQLGLPKSLLNFCYLSKGLVIVTGPTGSGKSTTLASLIDYINANRSEHIITIEDPIEFLHANKKCLVNQREVHRHTRSFKQALRAALREDPDIVLIGEMRDLETMEIALETAETGHLVFCTLHTNTAPSTVDRIIDQFPAQRQSQIRTMLASSLKGVVTQTLCRRKDRGRVVAVEVLVNNFAIASNIREGKTHQIQSAMQVGVRQGMRLLNDSLIELVGGDDITAEEAYVKSIDKTDMLRKLEAIGVKFDPSTLTDA